MASVDDCYNCGSPDVALMLDDYRTDATGYADSRPLCRECAIELGHLEPDVPAWEPVPDLETVAAQAWDDEHGR